MSAYQPKNPLRKDSKLALEDLVLAIDAFAHGIKVDTAAKAIGTSRKTMRGLYLEFRSVLVDPVFARWHQINALVPSVTSADQLVLVKSALFDLMAECHANEACYRNLKAGRRQDQVCRSCPLRGKLTSPEAVEGAVSLVHIVRDFYRQLGIHQEPERDTVSLFRQRLIHTATIAAVQRNSRKRTNGQMLASEKGYLSFGEFRVVLLVSIANH